MNLQGDFEGLSLASIFQLICNDEKTGVLTIICNEEKSRVFFDKGVIVYARDSLKEKRLGDMLKTEGHISGEQLKRSIDLAQQSRTHLGNILIENGELSVKTLEKYNNRQVETIIYNLFFCEQGRFEYTDQELDTTGMIVTRVNPMKLILEASRKIDELSEQMKKCIHSDRLVYRISGKVPGKEKINPNENEWRVLSLVDGIRTVRQMIDQSGYDEFTVYKILFSMISLGLIVEKKEIPS